MGCDIHVVVEWRDEGSSEWVGVYASDRRPGTRPRFAQRDYYFFARIAGVRGCSDRSVHPRNLPKDVSRLAWLLYMQAPTDHHNPSHMTVSEFVEAWREVNPSAEGIRAEFATYDLLGSAINEDREGEHRIVFWFDN